MKLPFIQHIGVGLHITDYALRWVEISRIRDKLTIRSAETERIGNGNIEASLRTLVEHKNSSYKYVTVNINSSQIKQELVSLPNFDETDYIESWLQEQADQLIPEGLNPEDFIIRNHVIGTEEEQQCLFVLVRKETVQNQLVQLEKLGLKPIAITVGSLQAAYGYLFNAPFTEGESWFLHLFEDHATLQIYRDGIQRKLVNLPSSGLTLSEVFQEVETYMLAEQQKVGSKHEGLLYTTISDSFGNALDYPALSEAGSYAIQHVSPLSEIDSEEHGLTGDYSVAAGMAVRQIYPSLDNINFLDFEFQDEIKEEIQKKDALHTGILLGGTILLLFSLLISVQFYFESSLDKAKQQVAELEDRITAVAEARDKVVDMNKRVEQARSLVTERTAVAQLMEIIGKTVPERVWLNEIKFHEPGSQKEIVVYGFAHNDALIASLMEQLEAEKMIENVRLIFSEKVEADEIYDESKFEKASLMQFEIRMRALSQY